MVSSDRAAFTVKNPCGNSGTSKPAAGPAVPLFPRPSNFRGHNLGKMRNRAGIIRQSPAGTDEVVYSNVMEAERGRGCGFGRGRVPAGGYAGLHPGNVRRILKSKKSGCVTSQRSPPPPRSPPASTRKARTPAHRSGRPWHRCPAVPAGAPGRSWPAGGSG
jgi:hypothetical protein